MNADPRPSVKSAVNFTVSCLCPYRHLVKVVRRGALVFVVAAAAHVAVQSGAAAVERVVRAPPVGVAVAHVVQAPPVGVAVEHVALGPQVAAAVAHVVPVAF